MASHPRQRTAERSVTGRRRPGTLREIRSGVHLVPTPGGIGVAADDDVAVRLFSDAARAEAVRRDGRHFFDETASAIVFLESPAIRSGWVRWCLEADDRIQMQAVTTVLEHFPEYARAQAIESDPHWRTLIEEFDVAQRRREDGDPDLVVDVFGAAHTGIKGVVEAVTADGTHHLVTALSLAAARSPRSRFCRDLGLCVVVDAPPGYERARAGRAPGSRPREAGSAELASAAVDAGLARRPTAASGTERHELVHVAHRGLLDALELLVGPNGRTTAGTHRADVRITVRRMSPPGDPASSAQGLARVRLEAGGRSLPAGDAWLLDTISGTERVLADVRVSATALHRALVGGIAHVLHFRDDGALRIEALSAEPHSSTIDATPIDPANDRKRHSPMAEEVEAVMVDVDVDAVDEALAHE